MNLSSTTASPLDGVLFRQYGAISANRRDEAFAASGKARAHWQTFLRWLDGLGAEGFGRAAADLDRLRGESGIAFAATDGEAEGSDTLPVILSQGDWQALEMGVLQRAELAEAAIRDVYGQARLMREGLVPPGLVYASPGFAAHCAGWQPPVENWMYVYEADIARAADGRWIVLADRLDTPLGDGWLLANRIATSEALAEPFVDLGVRRLASHYIGFQDLLDQITGWEGRLALVTGGDNDPRFFSHAYLARYMNAALIEPGDITVRDGAAFVKTLDGLKKLDFLLRGVGDQKLDALHRPAESARGAPALSIAARAGQLTLGNAIGASVFGHRGLAPFASLIGRALLDQELLINDAPCLWLGTPNAQAQVLEDRASWRIERVSRRDQPDPVLERGSIDDLRALLAAHGERFVATATPPLSHTPCWSQQGVVASEWMMRVFACRTRDGWSLAPGGVASPLMQGQIPPELGFGKDVWVLPEDSDTPPQPHTPTDRFADAHLRRTGRDLLSRVADEVYWLGRNVERAETMLRLLNVALDRYLSGNRADASPEMLCDLLAIQTRTAVEDPTIEQFQREVRDFLHGSSGIQSTLRALRSNAIRARSAISEEGWRYIDRFCSDKRWKSGLDLNRPADLSRLLSESLGTLAAFAGSAQENLTRNYAWRFLEIGRRIERGYVTSLVAERLAGQARENEESYLRAWLRISDSSSAYRSRYMMTTTAPAVIDLLVLDESNPRALVYQIERLEQVLSQLPVDGPYRRPEHRKALALLTEFRLADAGLLAVPDKKGGRHALHQIAVRCREDLVQISNLITQGFFAHADVAEALVSQARNPEARGGDDL